MSLISWFHSFEDGHMKMISISAIIVASLLTAACAVVPAGPGQGYGGVMLVPVLPQLVVLGAEPYYYYSGYHYHYRDNRWFYARSRRGPWINLPRGHYPHEVRFRDRGRGWDRGRGYDRDHYRH